jgi:hypothetical protein
MKYAIGLHRTNERDPSMQSGEEKNGCGKAPPYRIKYLIHGEESPGRIDTTYHKKKVSEQN